MRRLLTRGVLVGILAGAGYALWKKLAARQPETGGLTFEAQPFPSPPRPVPKVAASPPPAPSLSPKTEPTTQPRKTQATKTPATKTAAPSEPWLDADDGACPISHPVKAKLASGIFHVPGGQSYERTKADRCYPDAAAAEADGLRPAKR